VAFRELEITLFRALRNATEGVPYRLTVGRADRFPKIGAFFTMSDERKDQPTVVHLAECSTDNPEAVTKMMRSMQGPQAVDHALRAAVSVCWMMLPDDKKNVDAVDREIRRLVDRILADLREDAKAFGVSETR
jgi:hypothetical protein